MAKRVSSVFLDDRKLPCLDEWSADLITPYSGSDRKEGLIAPDGRRFLVKYAEAHTRVNDLDTSYVNNVLSEYMERNFSQGLDRSRWGIETSFRKLKYMVGLSNSTGGYYNGKLDEPDR